MPDSLNKRDWNDFVLKNNGSFLQSYEWGEFQERAGKRVFRFSSICRSERSEESFDWAAQFIETKLPGVNKFYWYAPRGPVMANGKWQMANGKITSPQPSPLKGEGAGETLSEFIKKVKETIGKNVIFFRIGPEWDLSNRESLSAIGFQQLPYDIEPAQTRILDIIKSEKDLLAQMHEKWRYNIRLAERKDVRIKLTSSQDVNFKKYFEEFYRLVSEGTAERKNIRHYPKEYYRKQLEITSLQPSSSNGEGEIRPGHPFQKEGDPSLYKREVGRDFKSLLFIAEYEGKVIAANIIVLFGGRATYLHGATSSEHREVMAPHLLQWEQIKYAKSQGCAEYDFWGIVNEHTLDRRGASWAGFTRFKRGFGGQEVNYVGYWDYPLDKKWYKLYRLVQKFRR